MHRIAAFVLSVMIAGSLVGCSSHDAPATSAPTSPTAAPSVAQVLAAASVAQQKWLSAFDGGATLHVVDEIYERPRGGQLDSGAGFHLPDSRQNEIWMQLTGPSGETAFCNAVSAGAERVQSSYYDSATKESVITDGKTGEIERLPIGAFSASSLRASVTGALGQVRSATTTTVALNDTSLGRSATVIIGTVDGANGERSEKRDYFDRGSGELFGEETWAKSDTAAPVLQRRVVRTIEVLESASPCSPGPPASH